MWPNNFLFKRVFIFLPTRWGPKTSLVTMQERTFLKQIKYMISMCASLYLFRHDKESTHIKMFIKKKR